MSDTEDTCTPPASGAPRFRPKRDAATAPVIEWPEREEFAALETRVFAALRSDLGEEEFDALALDIHAFQRRTNEPYARWCATLPTATTWRQIPAVPQAMFKRYRLACFPPELSGRIFKTSGTTGETRGTHHLLDTRLYEASVLAGWDRCGFPPHYQFVLSACEADAPDSSLACMWRVVAARAEHHAGFVNADGSLASPQLEHALERFTTRGRPAPIALLGTALGFLNFFEQRSDFRTRLAPGSYVVETGGFKGTGREITKEELHLLIGERLGISSDDIWNEYGMCELGSQFYTRGIGGFHRGGPWVRALVISPETGREVAVGETGVLRIFDLANLGSVLAIETSDLAIRHDADFELIGRAPGAGARGCSRTADESMRNSLPNRLGGECESALAARTIAASVQSKQADSFLHTDARAHALAAAATRFDFLGPISADDLIALVSAELGDPEALDRFVSYAEHRTRAVAPRTILHILSGNTPAAALQSLIRGLLLGSHNRCKLPSAGLPEVAEFVAALPPELAEFVETSTELTDAWLANADAVIAFGNDSTIAAIRARCRPDQIFVPHGHRLSFCVFFENPDDAALADAARDASLFDQQGCLSPHMFFVRESESCAAASVAARLADAMRDFQAAHPRSAITISEALAIREVRAMAAFRAANGEPIGVYASDDTSWTVIADSAARFTVSPLNRTVFVQPCPDDFPGALSEVRSYLSTCGIWPANEPNAAFAATLGVSRICTIGKMQQPPLAWHHDGVQVLAPLVRWVDCEIG